jgi:multimeric flavodoxin WrbA
VELVSVADHHIAPCTGCNTCFARAGNRCYQADDMDLIYENLDHTDVLVLASPVYFYGVSAQLTAIIDRLHTPMRNRFPIQKLALLLVGGASLPQLFDAILVQYRLTLDYFHLDDLGTVLVRGVRERGDIVGHPALQEAYDLGLSIPSQESPHSPSNTQSTP